MWKGWKGKLMWAKQKREKSDQYAGGREGTKGKITRWGAVRVSRDQGRGGKKRDKRGFAGGQHNADKGRARGGKRKKGMLREVPMLCLVKKETEEGDER